MILDKTELNYRYNQRIRGVKDKKVYIGPEIIVLLINNTCNLTCKYCWTHAPGNPRHFDAPKRFTWDRFVETIDDAVDLKVDYIYLSGSGEPTLHPSFREMMGYLEGKPIGVRLYTNATFPLEFCDSVIKGDRADIDLSAVTRDRYRSLQGKDLFDRVVANIKRLVTLRDTVKPSFYIEIVYIVNADNADQAEQMRTFAVELGVNSLLFKKMNVHDFNGNIAMPENFTVNVAGEDRVTPPECLNGWFFFTIKPDDMVSTCCRIERMPLGDMKKISFKQFWLSQPMMNVRLLGKYGQIQKQFKACQTCPEFKENITRMYHAAKMDANENEAIDRSETLSQESLLVASRHCRSEKMQPSVGHPGQTINEKQRA